MCRGLGGFCLEDSNVGSQPGSGCRGGWKETEVWLSFHLPQNKSACRFIMLLRETLHYKYLSFIACCLARPGAKCFLSIICFLTEIPRGSFLSSQFPYRWKLSTESMEGSAVGF